MNALVKDVSQWFKEFCPWKPSDMDNERVTWTRCYDIPCQAWKPEFFKVLVEPMGVYLCSDDNT